MANTPSLNIYFAGELFTHKDLAGNALLAEAISDLSDQRYCSVLPQNLARPGSTPRQLRDYNLLNLLECDLALFCFDGDDLDSGTVVEYMMAKFADIPTVIVRSDFRTGVGDAKDYPWNLMACFYPRTEVEIIDAMSIYQNIFKEFPLTEAADMLIERRSSDVAKTLVRVIAQAVVDAFDRVLETPSRMTPDQAEAVYAWLVQMPGFGEDIEHIRQVLSNALQRKRKRGLLP
ncbi:nucleoside 2-deoxyribosyltransferase [Ruficoccus amylovorans]|uniref:Nucleoside 2-deoxyribosyltransferase n=1 Tax=Ruficoccus amylovorans TaxID=1804625 RepID=A0A842HHJ5_9BACT|nr:nucleoside 2-deoxyribosyltransferase [Ruficoccus amylovorans]MBC2596215.1 nucleoside 2-deoxyribosyltransferase [Ruficoccus amylovorans]